MSIQNPKRKSGINYSGSSDHLKKDFEIHKVVNFRIRIFMLILVGLVGLLVYRLYTLQIVQAEHFQDLLLKQQTANVTNPTMRGEFLDRNGEVIVSNKAVNSVTYSRPSGSTAAVQWDIALAFVRSFTVEDTLNEMDLKTLWLYLNENGNALLTEAEQAQANQGDLSSTSVEALKYERITAEMIDSLTSDERKAFKIKVLMDSASSGQSVTILQDISNEDVAFLAENALLFPGFTFQTSWDREYTDRVQINSIIGSLSSIPYEKLDYYLAAGYSRNDNVGTFGLEYQYEELLSGVKTEYETASDGSLVQTNSGSKGNDLKTSIDLDLQEYVENAITNALTGAEGVEIRETLNQMHMVVSDPQTGDILAIAAIKRTSDGSYINDPQSVFLSAFPVGSVVKGATVYMGLDQGVIEPGEVFLDAPMYIQGTAARHSWRNLGNVSDLQALQLSSNVYMFHIAIRLGGTSYVQNGPLTFPNPEATFDLMRSYYSKFGLGVYTQVDFPREETGYKGVTSQSGAILEFAIGQFDSYTAIQLSQYINTLANGGYRLKPRLVIEALNHDTQTSVYQNNVEILSTVDNQEVLARVREGLRLCVVTNNCGALASKNFTSAAKTGTAQTYNSEFQQNVVNSTFIAFAPFETPKVSVACIAPDAYRDGLTGIANICRDVSAEVMDYYMNSN